MMTLPNQPNKPLPSHSDYRPDIDGLRAIAVLSVVFFHAFPDVLPGGFVGVDIFFVLSGYLISRIIFQGLAKQTFSFADFYSRRIKRIFPALVIVLIASYSIGWFLLLPDEFGQIGKHMFGGAFFSSNLLLLRETGYFDEPAATKPLLHLWSLGIEEQFYIFWPALLAWTSRRKLHTLGFLVPLLVGSFALNILLIHPYPSATFYLPFTRSWELLVGSTWAYLSLAPKSSSFGSRLDRVKGPRLLNMATPDLRTWLGISLVALSILFFSSRLSFPGWWALVPTLGAVLLISAGSGSWFNRTVLSSPLVVWFGLISYPLYLWHWPVLVFARLLIGHPLTQPVLISCVTFSILMAWLTYRFVERPVRFGNFYKRR